ncbi:diguanylate cyclase [Curvibacter sp. HBC61]|uniref:Diguanylate cyclase n=1 Tax=Curvibacter cyanobacteriorum TaxID=3026422 RepID=A0ABT5MWS2_9BURK|nr:diguanylate cyclase [Curvibacter sp. HBC61]MDD0838355.1 diguanylate cyclase [Curvibacter sp. HBC61]
MSAPHLPGRPWRLAHSLRARVWWVAAVPALLAVALAVGWMGWRGEALALSQMAQAQAADVALLASLIEARAEQTRATLGVLARDLTPERLNPARTAPDAWATQRAVLRTFDFVDVAAADGRPLWRQSQVPLLPADLDEAVARLRTRTLAEGQDQWLAPLGRWPSEKPLALMSTVVRGPLGEVRGVLVAGLSMYSSQLLPPLVSQSAFQGETLLVYTAEGRLLHHPQASRLLGLVQDEAAWGPVLARGLAPSSGPEDRAVSQQVGDALVSQAVVPSWQWRVARISPVSSVLAPYQALRRQALGLAGVAAVLAAALATYALRHLIQPVTQLRRRALQVLERSAPAASDWPQAGGEVGELITILRQIALAQEREHQRLRVMVGQLEAILEHASIGIVVTRHRTLELLGHQASAMLGYAPGELHGQPARVLYPSEAAYAELGQQVRQQFCERGHFDGELVFRRKDGSDFWVHMLGRGVVPDDPEGGTIWIFDDITAEREARRELSWSATHDSLTGLVNRRELEQRLARLLQAEPTEFSPGEDAVRGCLLFVDLDHFKPINDGAGHAAGDLALQQIARLMEAQVRQSDTVGRLGGDEFALLLPACSVERAEQIADSLCRSVADWPLVFEGQSYPIGCSIGLVALTPALGDVRAVLHAADMACYRAKRAGRNRVAQHELVA